MKHFKSKNREVLFAVVQLKTNYTRLLLLLLSKCAHKSAPKAISEERSRQQIFQLRVVHEV